ncbi:MAG: phosphoribosylformylglycinamidine synthase [Rickettsiales bacterium]|jgi:phosphoribosylformylglycinamidine synthase|nr:phosphoribosylformylglycinamidine synthase [Rickettsiales bacterium]
MKAHEQRIPAITPQVVAEHGLTTDEYDRVLKIMGREPNLTELGIFSVMWSEHCSYKTTRIHLKKLHTTAPWVICGPGENAGVIDIGDGQAAIFKMESHNHPSFIEPFQGAATGVGGIMRDVFTMGARPVANLNALRFGAIDNPKTKRLLSGVVAGIGGYGNCMGVPTVAGECIFHPSYNGNILVNAMTVGIAPADKIFYSAAGAVGSPVVYIGSKTGRDGIHGATMASAEFDDESEEKRPTVQVGDPFAEKLLLEACLELMATDAIIAIQDMGAAGLTCSSLEMADKGGAGIELELDKVPMREEGMTPYEIMLSESQERMLMVIKPEKEVLARAVFEKWELDFAVIGTITNTGKMILKYHGEQVAELPVKPLSDQAPVYDRPWVKTPGRAEVKAESLKAPTSLNAVLKQLLVTPDLASKRWIWQQYDRQVMNNTVSIPGGDAAVVRIDGTNKGLALTSDVTPRYCEADPVEGGKQAVAETYRNICAVGGTPLAITNCLNFGNPQKPEVMGQIVGCLEGMTEACKALDYPVISGNVSLYNETNGKGVQPTPSIGGVGILHDVEKHVGNRFKKTGDTIYVIGKTAGHIGASIYLREIEKREEGTPPSVDLSLERKHGEFVRGQIEAGTLSACHDVSDGGLYVAIAEMAMASGLGAEISLHGAIPAFALAFAEDQARYVVTVASDKAATFENAVKQAGVDFTRLGTVKGSDLIVNGDSVSVAEITELNEAVLPKLMA